MQLSHTETPHVKFHNCFIISFKDNAYLYHILTRNSGGTFNLGVPRPTRKSTKTMRTMAENTAKSLMITRTCSNSNVHNHSR